MLFKTDAEKEGKDLAEAHLVQGFPTFVLVNASGATIDRWSGYAKDYFLERMGEGLADLTTIDEKRKRFEATPRAADAVTLARYHETRGEYVEAVGLVDRAMALEPAAALLAKRFDYLAGGFVTKDAFSLDEVTEAADAVVASGTASAEDALSVVWGMKAVGRKVEQPKLFVRYLEPALAATRDATDESLVRQRRLLRIDRALHVTGNVAEAVALKRETLPEGWKDDSRQLNSFAWWCFENGVNLEEAESLAMRGIDLAAPGEERAAVLDTAAELLAARGDPAGAVALMRRSVEEAPEREYYRKQLERFEEAAKRSR